MKALTILQPWAHAVAHLGKRIENRTWRPPEALRGQAIAIHAGARSSLDLDAVEWLLENAIDTSDLRGFEHHRERLLSDMSFGAVVAVAKLSGVLESRPDGPQSLWWCGPLAWDLFEVVALPSPVPCRGMQRLWELPEDVLERVVENWAKGEGL